MGPACAASALLARTTTPGHQPCPLTRPHTCVFGCGQLGGRRDRITAGFPGLGSTYDVKGGKSSAFKGSVEPLGLAFEGVCPYATRAFELSAPLPAAVAGAPRGPFASSSPGKIHSILSAASRTSTLGSLLSSPSRSASSYLNLTTCLPFLALKEDTDPTKNAPASGRKTRTRRPIAKSPGASAATLTHTAEGRKSRILGLAARLDLRTPVLSSMREPAPSAIPGPFVLGSIDAGCLIGRAPHPLAPP